MVTNIKVLSYFLPWQGSKKNLKNYLQLIFCIGISCSPATTKNTLTTADTQPTWMTAKPVSSLYYVGIGRGQKKSKNNYIQQAKKNALADMISEIKVNISSTSTLSIIAGDKTFYEKYEQIINTTTSDELQEYEQVGSWEDEDHYWVYYRLSKERYKKIKEEQKKDATTKALDFFVRAKQYEEEERDMQAMAFYFKGLTAIEKYLAYPLRIEYQEKEILLTNELYASIQRLLDDIQLSVKPTKITLNRRAIKNTKEVVVHAIHKKLKNSIPNLPLKAAFKNGEGDVFPHYKTDAAGKSKITITKIISKEGEQTVQVKMDILNFAGDHPTAIYGLVANKMIIPHVDIVLTVQRPVVYITSLEKGLEKKRTNARFTNRIKNYLTAAGFTLTDKKNNAELWISIKVNLEKGAISGSLYTAYATANISVADPHNSREIYTVSLERIKDYSLDYPRAKQAAYEQLLKKLEKPTLPKLLDALL